MFLLHTNVSLPLFLPPSPSRQINIFLKEIKWMELEYGSPGRMIRVKDDSQIFG